MRAIVKTHCSTKGGALLKIQWAFPGRARQVRSFLVGGQSTNGLLTGLRTKRSLTLRSIPHSLRRVIA